MRVKKQTKPQGTMEIPLGWALGTLFSDSHEVLGKAPHFSEPDFHNIGVRPGHFFILLHLCDFFSQTCFSGVAFSLVDMALSQLPWLAQFWSAGLYWPHSVCSWLSSLYLITYSLCSASWKDREFDVCSGSQPNFLKRLPSFFRDKGEPVVWISSATGDGFLSQF